jgi:hypothetical protein
MKSDPLKKTAVTLICLLGATASAFALVVRRSSSPWDGAQASFGNPQEAHAPSDSALRLDSAAAALDDRRVAVLNRLRNEINLAYGFKDFFPRVDLGPCGRFAKAFRERWNARFSDKVEIAFLYEQEGLTKEGDPICPHILVKLPDGSYFDGGNGVVSGRALLKQFPSTRIEEMKKFDLALLEKNAGGLGRDYPRCPDYSDDTTAKIIDQHLSLLPKTVQN